MMLLTSLTLTSVCPVANPPIPKPKPQVPLLETAEGRELAERAGAVYALLRVAGSLPHCAIRTLALEALAMLAKSPKAAESIASNGDYYVKVGG